MTNLEKMNELVGASADKKQVMKWAYMNRVWLIDLPYEPEFSAMDESIKNFLNEYEYSGDEDKNWDRFLDMEYIPPKAKVGVER
jgi:hypothetical protein